MTLWPCATRRSQRCEPTKPAPPVTRMRFWLDITYRRINAPTENTSEPRTQGDSMIFRRCEGGLARALPSPRPMPPPPPRFVSRWRGRLLVQVHVLEALGL